MDDFPLSLSIKQRVHHYYQAQEKQIEKEKVFFEHEFRSILYICTK